MKRIKLYQMLRYFFILLILGLFINISAQDKHRTYLKLNYLKNTEGKKLLIAELKTRIDGNFYTLKGQTITFSITGDSIIDLGEKKTDKDGIAQIEINGEPKEGMVTYAAEYEGSDTLRARDSDVEVKDLVMTMKLEEIDSVKTITVTTKAEIDPETEEDISEGIEIQFFVKRLFSLLPLGNKSIEDGECSIEFPNDLPGDSVGNVIVIAKIVDHDDFANVEQKASINWGIPVKLVSKEYNPFVAGPYIRFMVIAIVLVTIIVFVISKILKKKQIS